MNRIRGMCWLLVLLCACDAKGPEQTLMLEAHRPLAEAARTLSEQNGYLISYEDPRYTSAPEMQRVRIDYHPGAGAFGIAQEIVDAAKSKLPDHRFRVLQSGNWVHIVPDSTPLDVRISLSAEPRTDWMLIRAICDAMSQAAGVKVIENSMMHNGIEGPDGPPRYTLGANDEVARDVLRRALDTIFRERDGQVIWLMMYGNASTEDEYVLNLVAVPKP